MSVDFDASDFLNKIGKYQDDRSNKIRQATSDVASEVLRLSQIEVPHDTGELQNSGSVTDDIGSKGLEKIVGYNKVYAARLHEHPEYNFQNGRKGKYLEDPIKNNLSVFIKYMRRALE